LGEVGSGESQEVLRSRARKQSLGLGVLAWIVAGGVFSLTVILIRKSVGGQVSMAGLGFSYEDVDNLRSIELWIGSGISLAVGCFVGLSASSDLAPRSKKIWGRVVGYAIGTLNWWRTFFLPIVIATCVFGTLYYWGYAGMLRLDD